MNRIISFEANTLALSDWMVTFFSEGIRLYNVSTTNCITATICTWSWTEYPLITYSRNEYSNPLTSPSTFHLISIILNNLTPFYHNNQLFPRGISSDFFCYLESYKWLIDLFSLTTYYYHKQKTAHLHEDNVKHSVWPYLIALSSLISRFQLPPYYLNIVNIPTIPVTRTRIPLVW